MPVRIAYELIDGVVCEDIDVVEHILQDMLECYIAECVSVDYCKTGIHLIRMSNHAKLINIVTIFATFVWYEKD